MSIAAVRVTGVMAVGVETYANRRRMEKSLRLQNAGLPTEYNLFEADLALPKVKEADFRAKAKHLEYWARDHQPAMLCNLAMTNNVDSKSVPRYPVGTLPVVDPATGETPIDELGRRKAFIRAKSAGHFFSKPDHTTLITGGATMRTFRSFGSQEGIFSHPTGT